MTTHLPVGFAAATLPISAATITTDTEGLEAEELKISSGSFEVPAYQAKPKRGGPFPLILVIQEIFGVHEHIKDICRRLAKEGYFAIAPELFARQGDVSKLTDIQEIIQKAVSKVPDAQVMADLDAVVEHAKATGKADIERLGMTGFCWGGRITWLYAAHQPQLKAAAAWYGRLVPGPHSSPLQPNQPVDLAASVHGAVLGLYGGKDQGIPLATVEQMRDALRQAGKDLDCEIVVYPDAGHAFHADYRPSYHEPSAKDAWSRMISWFQKYGVA